MTCPIFTATSPVWIRRMNKENPQDNFYSYGIEPNRKTLEALFRYSYQQGLSSRQLRIEELFVPSSLDLVES
jgi:hypothetical protein